MAKLQLSEYLPYVLRRADQTLSAPFYAVLTQKKVARSEWRVLAVLYEFGAMGIAELTSASLSPQPTVTHAVRRLEERHLVTRTPGEHDKRQRIVSVTKAGAKLTDSLMEEAKQLESELLSQVPDVADLIQRLHEATESIQQRIDDNAPDRWAIPAKV